MLIKSNKDAFIRSIPDENNLNNFDPDYFDIFNVNRLSGFDKLIIYQEWIMGLNLKKSRQTNFVRNFCGSKLSGKKSKLFAKKSGISTKFSDL